MRHTTSIAGTSVAIALAASIAGCATTTSPSVSSNVEMPQDQVEGQPVVEFASATTSQRSSMSVQAGLFGDINDRAGSTAPSGDGAGNIVQVSAATEGACFDPDISPSGKSIAFASTMHRPAADIYIKSTTGHTVTQITDDAAEDWMPSFSPDGTTIAFCSNRTGTWNIYTVPVTGGRPVQVTSTHEDDMHPTWSPDGRHIAFCRKGSQSDMWELWVVDPSNTSTPQFLTYGVFPQWSPDIADNRILFQRPRERGSRLHGVWTLRFTHGEASQPTEIVSAANAATINPAWSPDGSRIAFAAVVNPDETTSEENYSADIWVINADGTGRTNLTNGGSANYQPAWGRDGRIYFVSDRSGTDNIWAASPLGAFPAPGSGMASVTPE